MLRYVQKNRVEHAGARRFFAAILLALLSASAVVSAGEGEPLKAEKLLALLDDADFDTRKSIEKKIEDLGEAARAALEKAVLSGSVETRQSAARLLGKLSKAALTLELRNAAGKPVPRAKVEIELYWALESNGGNAAPLPPNLESDEHGQIKLEGLMSGPYTLKVKVKGHFGLNLSHEEWETDCSLLLACGSNRLIHTVQPHITFPVKVENEKGEPLSDATVELATASATLLASLPADVSLEAIQEIEGLPGATSDATGVANILDARPGTFDVLVRHADHAPVRVPAISLSADAPNTPLNVKMTSLTEHKNSLRFKLFDAKGEVLASKEVSVVIEKRLDAEARKNARIAAEQLLREHLFDKIPRPNLLEQQTSDAGEIELSGLAPGEYSILVRDEEAEQSYFVDRVASVAPDAQKSEPVRMRPAALGSIRGRVTTAKGEGVPDLSIIAVSETDVLSDILIKNPDLIESYIYLLAENTHTELTSEEGGFTAGNLPAGRYLLIVTDDDKTVALIPDVEVRMGIHTALPALVLESLQHTRWTVSGKILGVDGKAIPEATVYLMDRFGDFETATSSDQGAFELAMNGQRPEFLAASAPGYQGVTLPLANSTNPMNLVLKKAVLGSLRVSVSGFVERELRVRVEHLGEWRSSRSEFYLTVNPRGVAQQRGMRPSRYKVTAQDATLSTEASAEVDVLPGEETRVELKLPPPSRIEGTIKVANGAALPVNTQLVLARKTEEGSYQYGVEHFERYFQPNPDGSFQSPPVAPGDYTLRTESASVGLPQPLTVRVGVGESVRKELTLPPACKLRVECGADSKIAAVKVGPPGFWKLSEAARVYPESEVPVQSAVANAGGVAEFSQLPPGLYDVQIDARNDGNARILSNVRLEAAHEQKAQTVLLPPLEKNSTINGALKLNPATLRVLRSSQQAGPLAIRLVLENDEQQASKNFELQGSLARGGIEIARVMANGEYQKSSEPPKFEINGLKTGTYRVALILEWHEMSAQAIQMRTERLVSEGMPESVVLGAGETRSIGTLEADIPKATLEKILAAQRKQMEWIMLENIHQQAPNDQQPGFQP